MFWLLLALTILSLIVLIVGMAWTLVTRGETRRRSGPGVGEKFVADMMTDTPSERKRVFYTRFKGKATAVESKASFSFADIKTLVKQGQWQAVLPIILAIAGFLGLLLFGSLTIWLGIENKWVGGLIIVVALYAIIRTLLAFTRA